MEQRKAPSNKSNLNELTCPYSPASWDRVITQK